MNPFFSTILSMQISFDPGTITLFALIAQGIFASILLIFKRENKRANKYLALLIFLLSLWLCDAFFRVAGIYNQNPNFYFLPIYFSLAFGPLIYFYTKVLTLPALQFKWRDVAHFIPALLQFFFYLYLQIRGYQYRRAFWYNIHYPYTYDLELILSFTSILIYLILSLRLIMQYKRKIENYFSSLHRIALTWLGSLHVALSLLALFWLLESFARLIWDYYPITPLSSITIGFTIIFLAAGGMIQKDLSSVAEALKSTTADQEKENKNTSIDRELLKQLQRLMTQKELFLNQELTLKEFATAVGMPSREVSRTINKGLDISFIDFVNQYRIERVKTLIADPAYSHLSLLGIALESGFNSKSTFNRVFKKMVGKSPSEYQKEHQNAN